MSSPAFPRLLPRSLFALVLTCLWLTACGRSPAANLPPISVPFSTAVPPITPTAPPTLSLPTAMLPTPTTAVIASPTLAASPTPAPVEVTPCGTILPILPPAGDPPVTALAADPTVLAQLEASMPTAALPALRYLLQYPERVGLAAYQVGQEGSGAYLNAGVPMPLASAVKVIHLVAYAEAVADGRLDPFANVWLRDLEAFYQPGLDLRSHLNAIEGMEAAGRVFAQPPAVLLDAVPQMMIEYSSNAATDYLHMLLGQATIEQTAVDLGLSSQSAPCPFVGQFLAMANHTDPFATDISTIRYYLDNPDQYGAEVIALTNVFSSDPAFRQEAIAWRSESGRPNGRTQRFFAASLNAHGSAGEYAALLARIAQNGLSNPDSSYLARRYLEWPMRFEPNQSLFTNLGYKNGSLPGVLTTLYYVYRRGEATPVVVALFFRDLDTDTYRQWRDSLPHDELARWLLANPSAIPTLRAALIP